MLEMKTNMHLKMAHLLDELYIKINQIKESMTLKKKSNEIKSRKEIKRLNGFFETILV